MTAAELDLLLEAIGHGPENGTSVPRLAACLGLPEREIRAGLEELAERGELIVTLPIPGGRSVYIARSEAEFQAGIDHLVAKRDATSVRIARMNETKRRRFGVPQPVQLRMVI